MCLKSGNQESGSVNETQWLDTLMEDQFGSQKRIHELINADKELSLRQVKTQFMDAKIKSMQ